MGTIATKSRGDAKKSVQPISILVPTSPIPLSSTELYLDLMKRTLTRTLIARRRERQTIQARIFLKRLAVSAIQRLLGLLSLELVRVIRCTPEDYLESGHEAKNRTEDAETMLGIRQLDNMQECVKDVIRSDVKGDLLEAGVWRGGMTIFMRAILKAHGESGRRVWAADSFVGLPEPDQAVERFGWRTGDMAVSLSEVRNNFARYGLLDENVRFLEGFFSATLPSAPITDLAVLRVDADLYDSTLEVLTHLYPKLSPGGYAIVDDYQNLKDCQRAVDEYRETNGIVEPIQLIDSRAVYWQKAK